MKKKEVLLLSYWFPPVGGAGTQRISKACKYLPAFGWTPLVLTKEPLPDEHAHGLDSSLLDDVAGVEVFRVPEGESGFLRRVQGYARFRLGMDDWVDRVVPFALDLVARRPVQAVVTSLSPFAGYRVGAALQSKKGVPWVLDLRDPWALDGWRSWPTAVHAAWDLRRMAWALNSADAVIANTPESAREYARLGVPESKLVVVPNGYDEEDFEEAPEPSEDPERFVLVHVGTLHSADLTPGLTRNRAFRWRARQVAPLGRTGHYLLRALAALRERAPELASRIEVRLLGRVHASHERMACKLGVSDLVRFEGYLDHRRAVVEMRRANAIFVPMHGVPEGEKALVVPGKLYEALASGVTVLGALPAGDGADLVKAFERGVVVPPCDEAALSKALETLVREASGSRMGTADRSALAAFGRRALSATLAEVLERTLRRESLAGLRTPWDEAIGVNEASSQSVRSELERE